MFRAALGIFKKIDVQHAEAVAHGGLILDLHDLLKGLSGFLVATLIVLDNAEQIQGLGIAHVHGHGTLGKGFCRVPVLRGHKMFDQVNKRAEILRIFRHLTHELAHGLGVFASFTPAHSLLLTGRHCEVGILEPRLERGPKHHSQRNSQRDNEDTGGNVAFFCISHD